jgi:hypothetical protein
MMTNGGDYESMDLAILLVAGLTQQDGLTYSTHSSAYFPYKEFFIKTSNLVSVCVSCVSGLKADEIYGWGYRGETTMMWNAKGNSKRLYFYLPAYSRRLCCPFYRKPFTKRI